MPLIIVCGVPCCGKTKRSVEIEKILKLKGKRVEVINDQSCGIEYSDYGNFNKEKEARGKIRSELNKFISQETYVIIDSPNYIKVLYTRNHTVLTHTLRDLDTSYGALQGHHRHHVVQLFQFQTMKNVENEIMN